MRGKKFSRLFCTHPILKIDLPRFSDASSDRPRLHASLQVRNRIYAEMVPLPYAINYSWHARVGT